MRVNVKKLAKVKVNVYNTREIVLINIQTGEVDSAIETQRQVNIELNKHAVCLNVYAHENHKTAIISSVSLDVSKDINIMDLAALFTVHKEQLKKYEHFYDELDVESLRQQRSDRNDVREAVIKEEERYMKKLMAEEVKRIAKENIDAKRPPVTVMIPAPKKKTAVPEDDIA